ncbi:hypothetical protein, partial [Rhizobium leguminosarum]|uniref:hypothetical protein n=1 Tax=Rhizobium leguminosarum TaxID=384 RepID=UPI001952D167
RMARDACGAVDMRGSDESKPSMNHRNTVKRYRSPKKLKRLPCWIALRPLTGSANRAIKPAMKTVICIICRKIIR